MGRQKVRWAKPSARRESSVAHLLPGETSGGRQEPEEGGRARAERKLLRVTTDFLHGAFSASLVKVAWDAWAWGVGAEI